MCNYNRTPYYKSATDKASIESHEEQCAIGEGRADLKTTMRVLASAKDVRTGCQLCEKAAQEHKC